MTLVYLEFSISLAVFAHKELEYVEVKNYFQQSHIPQLHILYIKWYKQQSAILLLTISLNLDTVEYVHVYTDCTLYTRHRNNIYISIKLSTLRNY